MAESESGTTIQARDFVAKDGQTVEEPESLDISSVPMATSGSSTVTPRPSGTPTGVGTPRRRESAMSATGTGTNVGSPLANETTINVAEDEHHVVKAVAVPVHHTTTTIMRLRMNLAASRLHRLWAQRRLREVAWLEMTMMTTRIPRVRMTRMKIRMRKRAIPRKRWANVYVSPSTAWAGADLSFFP